MEVSGIMADGLRRWVRVDARPFRLSDRVTREELEALANELGVPPALLLEEARQVAELGVERVARRAGLDPNEVLQEADRIARRHGRRLRLR